MKINMDTDHCIIRKTCKRVVFNPVNNTFFISGIEILNGEFDADDEITVESRDEISVHVNRIHDFEIKS